MVNSFFPQQFSQRFVLIEAVRRGTCYADAKSKAPDVLRLTMQSLLVQGGLCDQKQRHVEEGLLHSMCHFITV